MWIGAADYAKGLFYEPRFYGQDYNTFLESLFALPYLYAGLPAYKALPMATHTLVFDSLFVCGLLFGV
jgi:hypothetical protein